MGNYVSDVLTIISFILFMLIKLMSKYETTWTLLLLGVSRLGDHSENYTF